ncbi:MAG TPA: acyl-ACP--UDP-N-acetylglucosamine O-acyltransferase [Gammaproteobacteria bacterium]|nr:acyl-ACP--UDP-N-acetylglucosamine O-acyltransferase [Gammaproteobacteria bacterium]
MIHSTAIIDPTARIGNNVEIGPWTLIGPDVEVGDGTSIGPHVVIKESTRIGKDNKIFQFASIGEDPQDKKFQGEKTWLEIGDRNVIREFCTFNRGTAQDKGVTRIGNDNLFMAYVHLAHDCVVGNHTIFANNASLAGHVIVEDFVVMSGFSGASQFCRVGAHSFASMGSMIDKDVPPFVKVSGYYAKPFGLNVVGMQRRGFSAETMLCFRRAYKVIYRQGLTIKQALEQLHEMLSTCPDVQMFIDFINVSQRGLVR